MSAGSINIIENLYKKFTDLCDVYIKCAEYGQVYYERNIEVDGIPFDKNLRDSIVECSFLKIFLGWENFIEQLFIYYSLDNEGINGKKLKRYITPKDYNHSYSLIKGISQYPDWTSVDKILKLANDYFENGGTFEKLRLVANTLQDIKTVRNSISHASISSKEKFESLVRNHIGYFPNSTTPSDFLLMINKKEKSIPTSYFNYYVKSIKSFSIELVTPV